MSTPQKTVALTQKEFSQIPGYTTKKDASYFRGLIIGLLEELGARGYGFVDGNLVFQMDIEVADGSFRQVSFRLRPAMITVKTQRRGHAVEQVPKPGVTWKLLYEYLRNKIAILKVGVLDKMDELGGNVAMLTDDGREVTMGEYIRHMAENDRLNQTIQLEDKR